MKPTARWFPILLGLLLLACGGYEGPQGDESTPPPPAAPAPSPSGAAPTAAPPAAETGAKIKVKNPAGETVVVFKPRGEEIKIEFTEGGRERVLRGKLKDSGKRKYQEEGVGPVAEVKPNDSGFKVRTTSGQLLWKVKISGEKIKVSDNEENRNPFVLKTDDDRVKILRHETEEFGRVKFYFDRGKMKVKDRQGNELFESNTEQYSAAFGLLMMSEIPPAERYIVMAELLLRDR